ncbi:hypothetical protein EDD22DRAFT_855129 [Suillus occidentalis]|nr:hypothetical protein EDD22DRAFT_855129 [Suillus occidentalis]
MLTFAKDRYLKRQASQPSHLSLDIDFEPEDFDPNWDRNQHAAANLAQLFEDMVGCEAVIQKLGDYQNMAQGMKASGLDMRNQIPTRFVFKGQPGTGKTTIAMKFGQVYQNQMDRRHETIINSLTPSRSSQTAQADICKFIQFAHTDPIPHPYSLLDKRIDVPNVTGETKETCCQQRKTGHPSLTIFPAFDQTSRLTPSTLLVNEAAKFRYRSGGHFSIGGLTMRTPTMAVGHGGLYHSQSPEGFFMGASGLKVIIPRSPIQCKGLLLSAIRDPNPVMFMEPIVLYCSAGSNLTLLTWGTPVYHCESALCLLNSPPPSLAPLIPPSLCSAKVELINLQTILPWDIETVVESVHRTKRLMIVHEADLTPCNAKP